MDNYRKLVYEDKTSLNDFDVNDKYSINHLIYEKWLLKRVEIDPFDANHHLYYLKAFNDAYYICTLGLLIPVGKEIRPDRLLKKVDRPSVVFPLVYLYMTKIKGQSKGIKLFLNKLDTAFKIRPVWQQNYDELEKLLIGYDYSIDLGIFAQRKLTSEVLSTINWSGLTQNFKKDKIESVVRNLAKNEDAWSLMINAIISSAKEYDYEYGFEDYIEEGRDENGPYTRTVKVPINPYDSYGNEILEPLKRAGVFQFCDELLTKFDELALKPQPMDIVAGGISETLGDDGMKSCFRHNNEYVKNGVTQICKEYYHDSHANLALIEKSLFENEWLKRCDRHKAFVKELILWGIITPLSEKDIKKVAQGMADKMRDLRNTGCNENDDKICKGIGNLIKPEDGHDNS